MCTLTIGVPQRAPRGSSAGVPAQRINQADEDAWLWAGLQVQSRLQLCDRQGSGTGGSRACFTIVSRWFHGTPACGLTVRLLARFRSSRFNTLAIVVLCRSICRHPWRDSDFSTLTRTCRARGSAWQGHPRRHHKRRRTKQIDVPVESCSSF